MGQTAAAAAWRYSSLAKTCASMTVNLTVLSSNRRLISPSDRPGRDDHLRQRSGQLHRRGSCYFFFVGHQQTDLQQISDKLTRVAIAHALVEAVA